MNEMQMQFLKRMVYDRALDYMGPGQAERMADDFMEDLSDNMLYLIDLAAEEEEEVMDA